MKIVYIALKYEYGDPERGFSYEHYNFYDCLKKMNSKQNQIIYFPFDDLLREFGRDTMNRMLIEKVFQEKPEICFFCISTDEIKKETIREITDKSGAITLNWFTDDHWRFENYSKYWASCFDWVITTDFQALKKYYKIGYKNVIRSQWACNHFLVKPLNLPKIYEVSFIGQPHGIRKKIIARLKKAGIEVNCWGYGWPKGRISQEEMIKIFAQSKINLDFPNISCPGFPKLIGKIFFRRGNRKSIQIENPRYWVDNLKSLTARAKGKQLKARIFEVLGCKAFLLTGATDDLKDYYQDGKEIVVYQDIDDLIEKIRYYLEHEEEREKIAQAGYQRTLKDHTYKKRFSEIFSYLKI